MIQKLRRLLGLEPVSPLPEAGGPISPTWGPRPETPPSPPMAALMEILMPSPTPTPIPDIARILAAGTQSFGEGSEIARVQPNLYDVLLGLKATPTERRNIAELSGQEASYGYAGPHITEEEQSYGPVHINLLAGRINPETGKPFTRQEAEDIRLAIEYALSEYRRTGGLGAWNPGAYPFYQEEIPERAKRKKFIRGI